MKLNLSSSVKEINLKEKFQQKAEKEEEIIASNRRLIDLMERKIEEVLSDI